MGYLVSLLYYGYGLSFLSGGNFDSALVQLMGELDGQSFSTSTS